MKHATDPCPPEHAFRFSTGASARSLDEFRRVLGTVPPEVVQHHREHFHHWVRDILQAPDLAERVRNEGQRARDGEQLRRSLDALLGASLQGPSRGATPGQGTGPGLRRKR